MTDKLTRDELRKTMRECAVPIFPNQSAKARLIAARLFLKYGIVSFLCGERQAITTRLTPFCRFHRLDLTNERLASEQLADFVDESEDCLFFLLPLTERDRLFVTAHAPLLESRLIITDAKSLLGRTPFACCH